ncbi:MAG: hypothetical protein HQL23_09665, partial [Candidatus Omnitrophica bacterium]|nr:hypothetical protein [Candidatus Omnitrophota bacterium]
AVELTERQGWTGIPCETAACYKFGALIFTGEIRAARNGRPGAGAIELRRSFLVEPNALYAHRSMVEVFNSPAYDYCEIEIHAPFHILNPGDYGEHQQVWSLTGK